MNPLTINAPMPRPGTPARTAAADRLEAAFLEQMLQYMGPQAREGTGSGGQAEAQFQSFLTQEYAQVLARRLDLRIARGIGG